MTETTDSGAPAELETRAGPRGAVRQGTVGVLSSGRLVVVERVDRFAAYLLSLPEQSISGMSDSIKFSSATNKALATSPYVSLEVVTLEQLSPTNRAFIDGGNKLPDGWVVPSTKPAAGQPLAVNTGALTTDTVKRGGEKLLATVQTPVEADARMNIVFTLIKQLEKPADKQYPALEQVVAACLQHEKFQSKSSHRAARWYCNELQKLGYVRVVE